jgi:flavorubredoxin
VVTADRLLADVWGDGTLAWGLQPWRGRLQVVAKGAAIARVHGGRRPTRKNPEEPTMHTAPKTDQAPTRIAPETFVIHDHNGEGVAPVMVPLNTMVIRGAEPVVVDTGVIENRDQFLADVFSVVEPDDIRWVFISHDDVDHTGNLTPLVEAAPNATVVVNWFTWERMGATLEVPLDRMRWVDDGGSFDVGDRVLHAVRPPVFDSPTTRGLFDPTTGVYWGSDSFAAPLTELVTNADQVDPEAWEMGMAMFHQYISPWFAMLDDSLYQRSVDRVEDLGVKAIAGCHAPTVTGARVADAFRHIRTFGQVSVPAAPGQDVLDMMLGAVPAV